MGPFNHLDTSFGFYFIDNHIFVGTVIRDARADMDFGDFFSHGRIPEIHLGQACDNGGSRAVPAVQQPRDFSVRVFVHTKLPVFSVESHQTSAASDTDIIHGFFTPDDQNFFHIVSFLPFRFSRSFLQQSLITADMMFPWLNCKPYASAARKQKHL
jgi:hypothetical protein